MDTTSRPETQIDPELVEIAERVLAEARRELENTGRVDPSFWFQLPDGRLALAQLSGDDAEIMNSGDAKNALFAFLRWLVEQRKATATVFLTDSWYSKSTAAGAALGAKRLEEFYEKHGREETARRGYIKLSEALVIVVQTPEKVLTLTQTYERASKNRIEFVNRDVMQSAQSEFSGRQKMFGDLRKETVQ